MPPFRLFVLLITTAAVMAIDWAPGYQEKLPSVDEPERTYRAYLPPQYPGEAPGLPILFLSSPDGNPDLKEYQAWSDRQGVILIGIDSSKNGPRDNNIRAQELVLKTLALEKLVFHPHLWFSSGGSGGAQSSWLLASRYERNFAGILMVAQGGWAHEGFTLGKHLAIAWLHGKDDPIVRFVADGERIQKGLGNPTKRVVIPGEHVFGSNAQRVELLEWIFITGVLNQPYLDAPTRGRLTAAQAERLQAQLEKGEFAACRSEAETVIGMPLFAKHPHAKAILTCWQAAVAAEALAATEPRLRVRLAAEASADPRMRSASKAKELKDILSDVRKDKDLNAEAQAAKMWVSVRAAEQDTRSKAKGVRMDVAKAAFAIVNRYPNTLAAADAQKLIDSLRAELGE